MRKLFLLVLLSGCATVGPDYQRPPVELPPAFPAASTTAAPSLQSDWWTLYGDATLNELVAAAQASNADLRLAAARVREAEAIVAEAGSAFLPEITGSGNVSRNRVSTRTTPPPQPGAPLERSLHSLTASTATEASPSLSPVH